MANLLQDIVNSFSFAPILLLYW